MASSSVNIFDQVDEAYRAFEEAASQMQAVLRSGNRLLAVRQVRSSADRVALNHICAQASDQLGGSTCLVTLIDEHTEFIEGSSEGGVGYETHPAEQTMCQYVVASGAAVEISDSLVYCSSTPGVASMNDIGMRSYHGEPIQVIGQVIGSFCALNAEAHTWTEPERETIRHWAKVVGMQFEDGLPKI